MKRTITFGSLLAGLASLLLFVGCSGTQSLQEYYVDNSENPDFLVLDVPANILKLDEAGLSETEKQALSSLRKLNILTFRKTEENARSYEEESAKVKAILKDSEFKELMKLNTKYGRGVVKYLGDEDAIDEVVIYGDSRENGFAVIRVLGKNMNPAYFVQLLQAIENADLEGEGLSELASLINI